MLNENGFLCYSEPATGSKEVRAEPYAAGLQGGKIKLRPGPWNRQFIQEHLSFPNGKYDDQVDSASGGFNKLSLKIRKQFTSAVGGKRNNLLQLSHLSPAFGVMGNGSYTN
jgi:phage terminase large subunit-like protein